MSAGTNISKSQICEICHQAKVQSDNPLEWFYCEVCGQIYHGNHVEEFQNLYCRSCDELIIIGIDPRRTYVSEFENGQFQFKTRELKERKSKPLPPSMYIQPVGKLIGLIFLFAAAMMS